MPKQSAFNVLKVVFFSLLLCLFAANAHAQILETVHATIHHSFMVGNTTLPAGDYTFRVVPSSGQKLMTVTSADGKTQAIFPVRSSVDASTPGHTELVFAHDGDIALLSHIYANGNRNGLEVIQPTSQELLQARLRESQRPVPAATPVAPSSDTATQSVGR